MSKEELINQLTKRIFGLLTKRKNEDLLMCISCMITANFISNCEEKTELYEILEILLKSEEEEDKTEFDSLISEEMSIMINKWTLLAGTIMGVNETKEE